MRAKALELKIATEGEIDLMIKAWEDWQAMEDAVLGVVNGEAIIRKV